jgi:tRNA dimethylallyltransferase
MTLVVICGATATGKSDIAVEVALNVGGEIINADSMQLYKGMDIGTAKITIDERHGIPHHLLDILSVREDASVAQYQLLARAKIEEITSRGNIPILVGGTGLYIKSVLDDMNFPETDPEIRSNLEAEAIQHGTEYLFARLQERDPEAAKAIDRANVRRIIRALEVIAVTGQPYSANLPKDESALFPGALHFGLAMDRSELAPRIERRVHSMFEKGLISEVQGLLHEGLREGSTAKRAIGYAQSIRAIDGEISVRDALDETIVATRQYVRRQETWFKRDQRIQWLQPSIQRSETIIRAIESQ